MFGRIGLIAAATLTVALACGGSAPPVAVKAPAGVTANVLPANGVDRQTGSSLRVLYVLDGYAIVSGDALMAGSLVVGDGAYSLPGANLVVTAGPTGAHYLVFTLTPATS